MKRTCQIPRTTVMIKYSPKQFKTTLKKLQEKSNQKKIKVEIDLTKPWNSWTSIELIHWLKQVGLSEKDLSIIEAEKFLGKHIPRISNYFPKMKLSSGGELVLMDALEELTML